MKIESSYRSSSDGVKRSESSRGEGKEGGGQEREGRRGRGRVGMEQGTGQEQGFTVALSLQRNRELARMHI
jgi:hypothetical protein